MQLADNLRDLTQALSELIGQHVKLAKLELKEDARQLGTQVGKIAAFIPLIVIGYILLCVAAALFLGRFLQTDVAFLIVAGVNLGVGGLGILLAVKKLKGHRVLNASKAELETTGNVFRSQRQ